METSPLLCTSHTKVAHPLLENQRSASPSKTSTKQTNLESAIMKALSALTEVQQRDEECDSNVDGFLHSLSYDVRQIPPHRLSVFRLEMMQLVNRYLHISSTHSVHTNSAVHTHRSVQALPPVVQTFHASMHFSQDTVGPYMYHGEMPPASIQSPGGSLLRAPSSYSEDIFYHDL